MKLTDMTKNKPSMKKLNKVTESRFGFKINYEALTLAKAEAMRDKIMEAVNAIRKSSLIHTAEQDPQYLEMLIVFEGLSRFIDATKLVESKERTKRKLKEGELGKSEAILAAKDMVDTVQDMIEKVGKLQNEQLPALIDTIRDQIGAAQADQFKNSVGQVLGTLSQQLNQSRDGVDGAARALTGEAQEEPMDMSGVAGAEGMPGAGLPDEMGGADDFGGEAPPDEFGADDAAAGGPESLGRERR